MICRTQARRRLQALEVNRQLTQDEAASGGAAAQLQQMLDESMVKFVAAIARLGVDVKM